MEARPKGHDIRLEWLALPKEPFLSLSLLSFFPPFFSSLSQSPAIDDIARTVRDVYLEHDSRCNYANMPPGRLFAVLFENAGAQTILTQQALTSRIPSRQKIPGDVRGNESSWKRVKYVKWSSRIAARFLKPSTRRESCWKMCPSGDIANNLDVDLVAQFVS
jgi:hypothetical protein